MAKVKKESKPAKVCDYAGYSCTCTGFKAEKGSLCVCGHYKSQHQKEAQLKRDATDG